MIGQMPTQQVIAMLRAIRPAQALGVLASMPIDRITHVMTHMEPADLAAMMFALDPRKQVELLEMVPADRRLLIFNELSMRQLADLLPMATTDIAAQILAGVSISAAAELLSDISSDVAARLLPLLPDGHTVLQAMYERQARESVVRAAPKVSWLNQNTCDLAADVFGRRIYVAIRFLPDPSPIQLDIDRAAGSADWTSIAGMLVVTNRRPGEPALLQAARQQLAGHHVELLRWIDQRDDGALKRALVKLGG
jgi:MgtE intracellular N domain